MLLRDPNFFEAVFASAAGMDVVNSLLLKRVYLRIMDYVREVLCEDWSEIPLPDFSKAVMGDVEELNRFLSLIILVSTSKAALRMEFEGLLGDIQGDGDYISNELKRVAGARRTKIIDVCRYAYFAANWSNVHITTCRLSPVRPQRVTCRR